MSLTGLQHFLKDLFRVPSIGRSLFQVWQRNFLYFQRTWVISMFWVIIEPVLYLLALGYGLGRFVGPVENQSYVEFLAPALMVISAIMVAFYESTYGSFTKLTRQKTFQVILLTPIEAPEIVVGEILWGASKGVFSAAVLGLITVFLKIMPGTWLLPALVVVALAAWIFSAFGLLMASYARNYDWFIYIQSGVVIPLTLFSGTYFPLAQLPDALRHLTYALPLTHAVSAVREILHGRFDPVLFIHLAVLIAFAFFLTNWAVARMVRRLTH